MYFQFYLVFDIVNIQKVGVLTAEDLTEASYKGCV